MVFKFSECIFSLEAPYEAGLPPGDFMPHNVFFSPILCHDLVVFCTAFSLAGKSAYPKNGVGQKDLILFFIFLVFLDLLDWSSTSDSNILSPILKGELAR